MVLKELPWDTDQLGISSGLIDLRNDIDYENLDLKKLDLDTLFKANNKIKFVTIKLASAYLGVLNHLIIKGAELMDTEITYTLSEKYVAEPVIEGGFSFKFVKKTDNKAFIELANEMIFSRFYKERRIPDAKANKLWRESLKNYCEGLADELLECNYGSQPCGLITLNFKKERELHLHIVGVLKKWRGKKVASMMLQQVINKYKDHKKIFVETQSTNIAAQKTYQLNGFNLYKLTYILHYWKND